MIGMCGNKALAGGNETGDGAFHIGGAAPVEPAVAFGRHKGRAVPRRFVAGGHHIGMAGEAQQRRRPAAPRPQVFGVAEVHFFDFKTDGGQALGQNLLAAAVIGGYGRFGNQLFGQIKGGGFVGRHGRQPEKLENQKGRILTDGQAKELKAA